MFMAVDSFNFLSMEIDCFNVHIQFPHTQLWMFYTPWSNIYISYSSRLYQCILCSFPAYKLDFPAKCPFIDRSLSYIFLFCLCGSTLQAFPHGLLFICSCSSPLFHDVEIPNCVVYFPLACFRPVNKCKMRY